MFWRTLKMELARAFRPSRVLLVIVLITLLFVGSDWDFLKKLVKNGPEPGLGSIDKVYILLLFDTFKCVIVVLLSGLYTNSFCKDDNSHYLRFILNRTDMTTYIQCRFLANVLVVLFVAVASFYCYVLVMRPLMPLLPESGTLNSYYYINVVNQHPFLYVGMMGIVFGLVSAACSSIGILYSSYKANSFVSIAISALAFFMALSYIPYEEPFSVLGIVSMRSTLGLGVPWPIMYIWTHVYMLSVVGICGLMFYRRMKWRMENGYL